MADSELRLFLLGTFRLERAGKEIILPRRKLQALLAYLVLHPEAHAREKLAALFWGDASDDAARSSLRNEISTLRKLVSADIILADRETIQLNPDVKLWTDARELKDEGKRMKDESTFIPHASSFILYSGDLLPDFYDDWILKWRETLRAQYISALLSLVQDARSHSEYARAIEYAQKILQTERADERAHQHLMFCYVSIGDRPAALKQYEECAAALRQELAVEPSDETLALYEWIKRSATHTRSLAARRTNLPIPLTSLIGRQRETVELKELLRMMQSQAIADEGGRMKTDSRVSLHPSSLHAVQGRHFRLLTLTGAGGSGKTRLAIQIGTDLVDAYRDGVWWVELAPLTNSALVTQALAQALGVKEQANEGLTTTLVNVLRERDTLLILDNCEHLIDACAQLAQTLLTQCPQLQILATSREALNVPGEVIWLVPLLGVPTDGGKQAADASGPGRVSGELAQLAIGFESVRLFVERATAAHHGFQLNDANVQPVIEICRRLDGIPLAIELAAACVKTLSVEQIAARLHDRFRLLTTGARTAAPRQQTLGALIDWSYDLLAEEERALFGALSVFAGGWTLEAAEFVCAPVCAPTRVLDLHSALVEKSLVVMDTAQTPPRYRMLETIREYARLQLEPLPTRAVLLQRHLNFFSATLEAAQPVLSRRIMNDQVRALFDETDNFRAALAFAARSAQPIEFARLFGALGLLWIERGQMGEMEMWAQRLAQMPHAPIPPRVLARALVRAAQCHGFLGSLDRALTLARQALELYRVASDAEGIATALAQLGSVNYERGNLEEAEQNERAAQDALASQASHPLHVAIKVNLALIAWSRHDTLLAHALLTGALEFSTRNADIFGQVRARVNLAGLANSQHDWSRALMHIQAAMPLFETGHFLSFYITLLQEHGTALLGLEQFDAAAQSLRRAVSESANANTYFRLPILFECLARIAVSTHQPQRAVLLLAAAEHTRASSHQPRGYAYQADYDATLQAARANLDAATFERAWAEGQTLSQTQAIALALRDDD